MLKGKSKLFQKDHQKGTILSNLRPIEYLHNDEENSNSKYSVGDLFLSSMPKTVS